MLVVTCGGSLPLILMIICSGSIADALPDHLNNLTPNRWSWSRNSYNLNDEIKYEGNIKRNDQRSPAEWGTRLAFCFPIVKKPTASSFVAGNGLRHQRGPAAQVSNPESARKTTGIHVLMAGAADKGEGKRRGRVVRYLLLIL
jgi:hypothetical protein